MNVYDFDDTIYNGDSTMDFYLFALKRHPVALRRAPGMLLAAARYGLKRIDKTEFKQIFFRFLRDIKDIDRELDDFWAHYEGHIKSWYLKQHASDDVVISASPEFLLRPIMKKLSIHHLLASRVDKSTGIYTGRNCDGEEKVRRFYERFPDAKVTKFYSDSDRDAPMARLAKQSFKVNGNTVAPWEERGS